MPQKSSWPKQKKCVLRMIHFFKDSLPMGKPFCLQPFTWPDVWWHLYASYGREPPGEIELVGATEIDQVEQAKVNLEKLVIWKPTNRIFFDVITVCDGIFCLRIVHECSKCFAVRSISHWSWICFENLWDLSELHIPNHFWKYISKNYLRNHTVTKKNNIHLKGHHQYFLQDHSPNFQGARKTRSHTGVGQWWFRRIRLGAGNSGIQDTLFDSNSASNVLVHLLAGFEEFMVCWSSFERPLVQIPVPSFGKCIYKPFQLGQREYYLGGLWIAAVGLK